MGPLLEEGAKMVELTGVGVNLGRMEIGQHIAHGLLEQEEPVIEVSGIRVPLLECRFHRVREAGKGWVREASAA